jgi:hypothetical protein
MLCVNVAFFPDAWIEAWPDITSAPHAAGHQGMRHPGGRDGSLSSSGQNARVVVVYDSLFKRRRDRALKKGCRQMEMLVIAIAVAGYFFATRTNFSEGRRDRDEALDEFGHR